MQRRRIVTIHVEVDHPHGDSVVEDAKVYEAAKKLVVHDGLQHCSQLLEVGQHLPNEKTRSKCVLQGIHPAFSVAAKLDRPSGAMTLRVQAHGHSTSMTGVKALRVGGRMPSRAKGLSFERYPILCCRARLRPSSPALLPPLHQNPNPSHCPTPTSQNRTHYPSFERETSMSFSLFS